MSEPLISCTQLTQIYRVGPIEVLALQGLDLEVRPGEMLGIIGKSGSGKSTLLQVVAGLLRPTAGSVVFDGLDLGTAAPRQLDRYRQKDIGFVWQSAQENLLPQATAVENLVHLGELNAIPDARTRANEMLDRVGLADRADHQLGQLSGGEQQRVALAMALTNRPRLLLADEPTGALDAEASAAMFELMREVQRDEGLTQIVVSHDRELARHVDRVLNIVDGRVGSELRWDAAGDSTSDALVIDRLGRLQLSEEHLDALAATTRVVVEKTESGLVIRPAGEDQ